MKLEWLGHACFKLTTRADTVIVTDPYDDSVGYGQLRVSANAATLSHGHHDHNNLAAVTGYEKVFDAPCDETYRDVHISSVSSFHDDVRGAKRGNNLLFAFEADGQRVVHLGDLGHLPDAAQLKFISGADALLIPVGGYFTIDTPTALKIAALAQPKSVIAMHFKNRYCSYPITDAEAFRQALSARELDGEIEINALSGAYVPKL